MSEQTVAVSSDTLTATNTDTDAYTAIISAANHPDPYNPFMGLFNYRSIKSLNNAGVDVNVVAPRPFAPPFGPYSEYKDIPDFYAYDSHEVHYPRFSYILPQKLFRYTLSAKSIQSRLSQYFEENFAEPDILHAGHIHYDGYGILPYCREHDIPFTVMGRGKILNNYDDMSFVAQSKIKEVLNNCSKLLCVSESLADVARDIIPASKVTVLPNGANPDRFPTSKKEQIRTEIGISNETTVILFCGGFTERKGITEIVRSLNRIEGDDVHLVFIGHYGELREKLLNGLSKSKIESYDVLWKISPLAIRRWFAVSDILIVPSHAEGRPNVVYEAMASETAVIGTNVSGIPEQVTDGETGILIPPKDSHALATAITDVLGDRERISSLGENGRQKLVDEGWTWEAHGQQLEQIHKSIINI